MALLSAHRGGPEATRPPNELDTIEAACALGVDLIEFDVRTAADGKFVIGHDPIAPHDDAPLTLGAVLDVIKGRARAHVDLKDAGSEVAVADLCIAALGVDGFVLTTGFDSGVRRVRTARPDVVIGLSLGRAPYRLGPIRLPLLRPSELWPWSRLRRCDANLVAPNYQLASFGVLAGAHRRGLRVLVWTLNTEAQIRAAQRDERVWAYTTDYPRLALRLAAH